MPLWILTFMLAMFSCRVMARRGSQLAFTSTMIGRPFSSPQHSIRRAMSSNTEAKPETDQLPIWNQPLDSNSSKRKRGDARVRQHVNPLARRYQQPTFLPPDWPKNVFADVSLPLHLDIGCGRGGFLVDLALAKPDAQCNYLGLEIRPPIVQYAVDRVKRRGLSGKLSFVGCNANVDLDRLLSMYKSQGGGALETVSIQFPDPHFKSQHAKRRVVTPELVETLAKYMPECAIVFLQSDVKEVLDDMRLRFRDYSEFFADELQDESDYLDENPMGIQTERERSVLDRGLPVYRTIFRRTAAGAK